MFAPHTYVIREAGIADIDALDRLAALDSRPILRERVLLGELDGVLAAAISLVDGSLVADPFRPTSHLAAHLRMRAAGVRAAERTPAVRDRIRAGLTALRPSGSPA